MVNQTLRWCFFPAFFLAFRRGLGKRGNIPRGERGMFGGHTHRRHPEVRALARLEGRPQAPTLASILRGSPKWLAPPAMSAIAPAGGTAGGSSSAPIWGAARPA